MSKIERKTRGSIIATAIVALVAVFVAACTNPFENEQAGIRLNLVSPRQSAQQTDGGSSTIDRVVISVRGADLDTITRSVSRDEASEVRLSVSAGRRTVRVQAFAGEALRYRGSAQVVLERGQTETVTIELEEVITEVLSSENSLISFGFSSEVNTGLLADRAGTINDTANDTDGTVLVPVSENLGTAAREGLIATFEVSDGATVSVDGVPQESGVTENDFTAADGVEYVVTAEDGTERTYTVTLDDLAGGSTITAFSFQQADNAGLLVNRTGTIDDGAGTIEVPVSADLAAGDRGSLIATFSLSDASATVAVDGTEQESGTTANDFTSAVTYTVTSQDGSQTTYTVSLIDLAAGAEITAFSFEQADNTALVTDRTGTLEGTTWTIEVSDAVDLTSLVATFTLSGGATARVGGIEQESGVSTVDFSSLSVDYVVTSEDGGTTETYTVEVTQLSSTSELLTFSFLDENNSPSWTGVDYTGQISGTTVSIGVTENVALSDVDLVASFTSNGASVEVEGVTQTSGTTGNRFDSPVTYDVIAEDGSSTSYEVTVSSLSNAVPDFATYSLAGASGDIDATNNVIRVSVPFGTDLRSRTPTFSLADAYDSITGDFYPAGSSDGSLLTGQNVTSGTTAHHFGGPVEYTVTSEDGLNSETTTVYAYYDDTDGTNPAILIPDADNARIAAMSGTAGENWTTYDYSATGFTQNWFEPSDIAYDAAGNIFVANSSIDNINNRYLRRFSSLPFEATDGTTLTAVNAGGVFSIAVDRLRDRVYYIDDGGLGTLNWIDTDGTDKGSRDFVTADFTGATSGVIIYGLDVAPDGTVYLVANVNYEQSQGSWLRRLIQYDAYADTLVSLDLDNAAVSSDFVMAQPPDKWFHDILWREGRIYVANDVASGKPGVLVFDDDLDSGTVADVYIDSFGDLATGQGDTDAGDFMNPTRFVAVLNRRFIFADDGLFDFGTDDRIVGFDSYDEGSGTINNWFSYGQFGYNADAGNFRFFEGC